MAKKLNGISSKLDYIADLGVDSVFLSAFYQFGQVDMGYDVIDHKRVDPIFGSNEDLEQLLSQLDAKGLKLIIDFIPNHTSNKHEWFTLSVNRTQGYEDFYVWRNPANSDWDSQGEPPHPPNNWEILAFWLEKSPVFGVRIGGFNLLFEDESDQRTEIIKSDVEATLEFLDELRGIAKNISQKDNTQRLFLLEMLQTDNLMKWQETYRNATLERGNVIPYNFGILPWRDPDLTGDEVHQDVQEYIATIPQEEVERRANALLCWEMDNHDKVVERGKETSRIPFYQNELVMMTTLLLPGTVIMYYGDEIGMSDSTEIKCQQSQDPFATPPYGVECKDYPEFSRDPGRAPMQWNNSTFAGFTEAKSGPWLPVSSQYPEVNVEWEQSQANSKLSFFKELMKIREEDPIYHGEVFYPYHDRNIFSFLRLVEETNIGLLVVANIHQLNDIKVDIHSVLPGVPDVGVIRAATSKHNEFPNFIVGEDIHLNQIVMASFEGLVIEIDFAPKEEHSL
eukprot:maker-scaffold187_size272365-snap-gene-1.32 protein:Tk10326 transcript:maker-scaffold187_size272365-snap-gene-1.32-mRNA-1 annotation:"neutral and basic amino acid transport protein rbat"